MYYQYGAEVGDLVRSMKLLSRSKGLSLGRFKVLLVTGRTYLH